MPRRPTLVWWCGAGCGVQEVAGESSGQWAGPRRGPAGRRQRRVPRRRLSRRGCLPRRSRLPRLLGRRPPPPRGHASRTAASPRRAHHAAAAGPAASTRDTGGFSRVSPRQDDAPPPAPVPAAPGQRPAVTAERVALALRRGMTFLSRTNRGLRPVAALLPHVDRARAVSPVRAWRSPAGRTRAGTGRRPSGTSGTARPQVRAGPDSGYDADPGYAPSGRDRGSGRARAGRTPQAARTTVPAGASAAQSRASGGTVRARQDPTSTVPMNTGLTSGVASTATSGTGLASTAPASMRPGIPPGQYGPDGGRDRRGADQYGSGQSGPDRYGPGGTGRASTALASAGPSSTGLSSTAPGRTAARPSHGPEQYGPGQYGAADQVRR